MVKRFFKFSIPFLLAFFVLFSNFINVRAMPSDEKQEKASHRIKLLSYEEKQERLSLPEGSFQLLPKEIVFDIYCRSKNRFYFSQTCKTFYSWLEAFPFEFSLTLPNNFSEIGDRLYLYLSLPSPPTILNLYYVSDSGLYNLGLVGKGPASHTPEIMKWLETPKGKVKLLKLCDQAQTTKELSNSPRKLIEEKGIQIEILPSLSECKRSYVTDSYLDILLDLYKPSQLSYNRDVCSHNHHLIFPSDENQIINLLTSYNNIKKVCNMELSYNRQFFRTVLIHFSPHPEKLSIVEQIFTKHLCSPGSPDATDSFIVDISHFNIKCVDILRNFIPPYEEHHYKDGFLTRNAEDESIISVEGNYWGVTRSTLFEDFMEISRFKEEEQVVLLKRFLPLLTFDHIKKSCDRKRILRIYDQVRSALCRVKSSLVPLSEHEYNGFISYVKRHNLDINLLEENSELPMRRALQAFKKTISD